jgi:hypothetical protein
MKRFFLGAFLILFAAVPTLSDASENVEARGVTALNKSEPNFFLCNSQPIAPEIENERTPITMRHRKETIRQQLKLEHFAWSAALGRIADVKFVLNNKSGYDVKDVEIECSFYGNSGTLLDNQTKTVFDIFKSKRRKKVPRLNMGIVDAQSRTCNCYVKDFVLIEY